KITPSLASSREQESNDAITTTRSPDSIISFINPYLEFDKAKVRFAITNTVFIQPPGRGPLSP
ncbi:MAG: hypothetical protein OXT49_08940, partial [Gammaproteobacteria bacterium]|nr:hypothetical protein [Gammaproteobacteria bacterium]